MRQFLITKLKFAKLSYQTNFLKTLSIQNNLSFHSSRICKNQEKTKEVQKNQQKRTFLQEFDCIYEFRYIKLVRLLARAKIYQTATSVALGGGSFIMFNMNMINTNELMAVNGLMAFALIMLYAISRETVRVVGRMYLSKDENRIMISHLNFFGKRQDFELNTEEIEPIASIDEINQTIFNLKIKNMEGHMVLSLPHANINKAAILKIFKIK
jgi:hypothetical protein